MSSTSEKGTKNTNIIAKTESIKDEQISYTNSQISYSIIPE